MPSRAAISLPTQVKQLLCALTAAGFEAYVVGGGVRDALAGLPAHDWDIATSALPGEVRGCFSAFSVIDTGLAHGTLTVLVDGEPYEITTFRTEGAYSDGRRPDCVTFVTDLAADLARRDFTVNAMAYHPDKGLIDPFGGAADLRAGLLRCVGAAKTRFAEDHLRILRALRFAACYGFAIAPETATAIHRQAELLATVASERVFAELRRLLCGRAAADVLAEFWDVAFVLTPELAPLRRGGKDVWQHTLAVLAATPPDERCRFAAYFHEAGKPLVRSKDETGTAHFCDHAAKSEELARQALTRLRADTALKRDVCALVRHHGAAPSSSEPSARRWLFLLGEAQYRRLISLWRAEALAQPGGQDTRRLAYLKDDPARLAGLNENALRPEGLNENARRLAGLNENTLRPAGLNEDTARPAGLNEDTRRLADLNEATAALERVLRRGDCFSLKQLAIGGGDLLRAGFAPGAAIGQTLRFLLGEVIDGRLANEPAALRAAATRLQKFPPRL